MLFQWFWEVLKNVTADYRSLSDLPGRSLQLSRCPCRGDRFAIPLPGGTPRCCQARQMVPPFFPHQPACSHHCLLPAEVFVRLWASWNVDLVQAKANPTKPMSDAQRQHTLPAARAGRGNHPFLQQHQLMQTKAMTTLDWLASWRTLSKYSSNKFLLHDKSFHCLFPYTNPDIGLDIHHGSYFWYTLEKRKGLQLCKNLKPICHHVTPQLWVHYPSSLN